MLDRIWTACSSICNPYIVNTTAIVNICIGDIQQVESRTLWSTSAVSGYGLSIPAKSCAVNMIWTSVVNTIFTNMFTSYSYLNNTICRSLCQKSSIILSVICSKFHQTMYSSRMVSCSSDTLTIIIIIEEWVKQEDWHVCLCNLAHAHG